MLEPTRRIPYRTWPASLAILAGITVYVGGLRTWDRLTPAARALPAQETIAVGQARFVPAEGWLMDVSRSRAGQSLVLFKSGHSFVVRTGRWIGGPEGPLARQQRLILRGEQLRIEGEASSFFTDWGLQGSTFAYYGPKLSGRFWQMVDPARESVVQVDFYGPNEDGSEASEALGEARGMLASMDLEAP
ncbi:MAG: hypothetical protein EOO29_24400 [Comamonadaceae bacterium]|nr:MAG: hypothetical protein EOO29_24400 [Comamonadaceae bacterium]